MYEFVDDYEIEINGAIGKYTGPLVDGMPHGEKGTMIYADSIYEGDWQNGNKHGVGTMKWFDKNGKVTKTRTGQWEHDEEIKIHRSVRNHTANGGKTKHKRHRNKNKNRRTKHNRKR
jgi:hypothetical protein